MSFFDEAEPPPPPPEPVEYRQPPWAGPPQNVVPARVAFEAILAQTGEIAVWVSGGAASPEGLSFSLTAVRRRRSAADHGDDPLWPQPGRSAAVRFGVGFADGRRATTDTRPWERRPTGDPATDLVLNARGGEGSPRRWARDFWLWPLPPEGPLTFALSWVEEGIGEATAEVDAGPIRAAAARAVELWPDDRPEPPADACGGWSSYAPGP
jgi:hypothetical protein